MYDDITKTPNYEDVLVRIGKKRDYHPRQVRQAVVDLADTVRGTRQANKRRDGIAAAMWTDYVRVLGERGLEVESPQHGIDMDRNE